MNNREYLVSIFSVFLTALVMPTFFPSTSLNSHWENSNYSGSFSSTSLNSCWEHSNYSGSFPSISLNSRWENSNYSGSFPSTSLNISLENSNYSGSFPSTSLNSYWENTNSWGINFHPLFARTLGTFQYGSGCWEHFRPALQLLDRQ